MSLLLAAAPPIDVKVSWLQFDVSAAPVDVRVSWLQFDSAGQVATVAGGGWLPSFRRRTRKQLHAERVRLGILPPDVVRAATKAAAVVLDSEKPYRADSEAVNRVFLRELGATKMLPDYRRAIQIQIELMQQEEEEILMLL